MGLTSVHALYIQTQQSCTITIAAVYRYCPPPSALSSITAVTLSQSIFLFSSLFPKVDPSTSSPSMTSSSSFSASRTSPPSSDASSLLDSASQTVDVVYQLSLLLNTGLDRSTVALLIGLCECGVNPEALATVVQELRREAEATPLRPSAQPAHSSAVTNGSAGRGS
jgi:mitotic-spindle organizing protein 1